MAKTVKQVMTACLILTLLAGLLAACTTSKNNSANSPSVTDKSKAANTSPPTETSPLKNGKFDPPITMTSWGCYSNSYKFKDGQSFEKNVGLDWIKTKLGIDIQYSWTSPFENEACTTKMRLSLSANDPLPDVVYVSNDAKGRALLADLINTGQFMDISQVFDQYASASFKDIMKKHPELWQFASKDGKHYGIPQTTDPYGGAPELYLREDWMKKLNLQVPKTIDELETIMDAFVNKDPDGNNKKDTYGYSLGTKTGWLESISGTGWIFGAYGTIPTYWIKAEDGSLQYGSIQPGTKEALAKLRSWYEKGYIDPEFAVKDVNKAVESVTAGKTGIISGPYWVPMWPLPDLKKNVEGASMLPIPLPSGPKGKPGYTGGDALSNVILINKKYKHPEAVLIYMNKMLQYGNKEKGSDVENGFVEGYDYNMVDGKPVADPDHNMGKILLGNGGLVTPEKNVESLAYLSTGGQPRDSFDQANTAYKDAFVPGAVIQQQMKYAIHNEFKGAATQTMSTKLDALNKMENELFTKIIYGKEPINAFDDFVKKWKSSGGDQITQEVNDWYKKTNGK